MQISRIPRGQSRFPARLPLILWCVLLLFLLLCALPAAADGTAETAVVSNPDPADHLNLREAPSQSSKSLGKYYNGVTVEVLEYTSADWVKVRIGTDPGYAQGYMMTRYLAFGNDGKLVESAVPILEANAVSWGILEKPLAENNFVGIYGYGEYAKLLGYTSEWWHLSVNGQTGFFQSHQQVLQMVQGTYYDGFNTAVVSNPNPEDRLNLRVEPSRSSGSLGRYYNGVTVAILQEVDDEWVKVRIDTLDGYMMRAYLKMNAAEGSVPSAMPTVTIVKSARLLNLREKPTVHSKSLGSCYGGTQVQVLGVTDAWYHVQAGGQIGFMSARYLTPQLLSPSEDADAAQAGEPAGGWDGPTGTHTTAAWTLPMTESYAIVNNPDPNDRLHLRTGTSREATSLGKYYNGVEAVILGTLPDGWTSVRIGTLTGYMQTKYLAINDATPPVSAMPVMTVRCADSSGGVQLREQQFASSRSLGTYPNGTQVVLMGFNDTWAHVIVDGQTGFMPGSCLQ